MAVDPTAIPGFDPSQVPVGEAPDGQVTNLVDAYSRAWMPRVAVYASLPFAVIFMGLRIYARVKRKYELGLDDYLCIIAGCMNIAYCGDMLYMMRDDAIGRQYWNVPLSKFDATMMHHDCAQTALYLVIAPLIKISILVLFLRIFSPLRMSRVMIFAGIIGTAAAYIALLVAWLVYTVPGPHDHPGWTDPAFGEKVEKGTSYIVLFKGAAGVLTDLYVVVIPLTAVSSLKLSTWKKVGMSALLTTGLLTSGLCAASFVPKIEFWKDVHVRGIHNALWTMTPANALAILEVNLGIVCACVPVVFPLAKRVASRITTSTTTSWRRYISRKSASSEEPDASSVNKSQHRVLSPKIPDGKLGTLMSLIRGREASRKEASHGSINVTRDTHIQMQPYSELRSVDMDYHAYIGDAPPSSYAGSGRRQQR